MAPSGGDIISSVQLVPPPQLLIDKSQQKYNPVSGKPEDGGGLIVGEIPPPSLPPSGLPSGFHLDAPQFEPVGIDPFQGAEYGGTLMPSMDSPNFDYNQQVRGMGRKGRGSGRRGGGREGEMEREGVRGHSDAVHGLAQLRLQSAGEREGEGEWEEMEREGVRGHSDAVHGLAQLRLQSAGEMDGEEGEGEGEWEWEERGSGRRGGGREGEMEREGVRGHSDAVHGLTQL